MQDSPEDKITKALMLHFPDMREHDVRDRTRSLSCALALPLSKGASWSLDNGSIYATRRTEWRVIIHDPPRGYMTERYNHNVILAVCAVWLAWKNSYEVDNNHG